MPTKLNPAEEATFQIFYKDWSTKSQVNPNPDDPRHKYDYRGAFKAGDRPAPKEHWGSTFKQSGHAREFVVTDHGILNTKTGSLIPESNSIKLLPEDRSYTPSAEQIGDRIKRYGR